MPVSSNSKLRRKLCHVSPLLSGVEGALWVGRRWDWFSVPRFRKRRLFLIIFGRLFGEVFTSSVFLDNKPW